ncbi:MAG: pyridoxal phosphate-dependent aminotransferase [Gammaproteobacteria bacterium]|nr:pyridoxal phosphate-dependent aminotransferase [Gammaproteobacteria bacterium]
MNTIEKSNKLRHVCYDIRGPVLDAATKLEAAGHDILKLNIGNPAPFGMYAEDNVKNALINNLDLAQGYCESKGIIIAREAIFAENQRNGFQNINIDDIILGNGVSELIVMAMQALLNDGDEMLIPMPDYPLWTAATHLAGGSAVHYVCDENDDWNPSIDDIKEKITTNTKGIVLINPNNPTGSVYSRETLLAIAELARQHNLAVFADEIYDKILYDDAKHIPFASLQDDLLVITFNGLSKSYRLAGFRAGWMTISGAKNHARDYLIGLNMLASMRLCSNVQAQYVIPEALNHDSTIFDLTLPTGRLGKQRDIAYTLLNEIDGVSCIKPRGAIYCFAKLDQQKFNIKDDEKMMLDLVMQKHMLLVQGTAFNWHKPDHFRIVFLPEYNQLNDALTRLKEFLNNYYQ